MKKPTSKIEQSKALEFSLSLVEAIYHTGQADMIQAAEQSLAALLNGAVALRGMRREPSPRCAANVMEFTRWLEKIPTRKAAARLGEQVNDELTIILSSVAEAMRELEFSHPVRDRLADIQNAALRLKPGTSAVAA